MKQVCMSNGQIAVLEVPAPVCGAGQLLVRTSHSLISTGTELAMTGGGGESLVRKALASPQLLQKVWDKVTTVGLRQTVDLVRARATGTLALGYSAAGEVVDVGIGVTRFRRGDRVACAGAGYANHAELNAVPENLAVRIPDGVSYPDAAFATLGAIALQGVRRLEPTLGEQVVVIGLGLIGQLAVQLLRRSGCRVFGVDRLAGRVALARAHALEDGLTVDERDPARVVAEWTAGVGADAVLVCASTGDVGLLNRSFELCRRKGRVVLVGDVPIRIARDRIYKKELDFRISCSYGPGRYDPQYEERGMDYPLAYVRWTEGRNLDEVLRLLGSGDLVAGGLGVTTVKAEEAPQAYDLLKTADAPVAVLLDFDLPARASMVPSRTLRLQTAVVQHAGRVRLGVVGAGAFFRGVHLPNLLKTGQVDLVAVASRSGLPLRDFAVKQGIGRITTDPDEIFQASDIDAVLIATRHNLHARYALAALAAGKHVFVEKPMAMTVADCEAIAAEAERTHRLVMVGFNRRFSPHAERARRLLAQVREPKLVVYRVNAGALPPDHWLRDAVEGGGRLLGEGVHFFDFTRWLIGSDPTAVHAVAHDRQRPDLDNVVTTMAHADGSTSVIVYSSQGHAALGKERVEAFGGGASIVIDDFRRLDVHGATGDKPGKTGVVQKGHAEIIEHFVAAVRGVEPARVDARDGVWATWCAHQAIESLKAGGSRHAG